MLLNVHNEFAPLSRVIIGLGSPYQRDKAKMAREMQEFPLIPNTAWRKQVLSLSYPGEDLLTREFSDYVSILENHGIEVLRANAEAAYSFDYTCPRDIGFTIGKHFFVANMAVRSRAKEFRTIEHHLHDIAPANIKAFSKNALIEGGDIIQLDEKVVLVGINQRTNREGYSQLREYLAPAGYEVIAIEHTQLHLDCCLNPLGLGHLLVHPDSLASNGEEVWQALEKYPWITVSDKEREHLATNILSIKPDSVIARDSPYCEETNTAMKNAGYTVIQTPFDGTPATGGSFRCASLVLSRS